MRATIFAPATAPGRAAVTIVRVSGPQAEGAIVALAGAPPPPPRRATHATFRDPADGAELDRGLLLWFPGPRSYTGEDLAELHLHGGRAVRASMIEALAGLPGLRPAEPGEFTRRAFENGKLDLTGVEAIADLVDAETRAQQRQALRQMEGALGRLIEDWRGRLVTCLAHLEASLDFPDEGLPPDLAGRVAGEIADLASAIAGRLDDAGVGERLREGLSIAILGPPNAGKSSLLNALARRDAAIVSERAGTTRDVIEVHLDLGGFPVCLADTAGLREAGEAIEEEGVRRARARAAGADLKLLLFDAAAWPHLDPATLALVDDDSLVLLNKVDLRPLAPDVTVAGRPALAVSVRTGEGMTAFLDVMSRAVARRLVGAGDAVITRVRHRQALEDCRSCLDRSLAAPLPELMAEDVRLAVRALGRITGRVDVEDLLDVIFRDFCIGK